MGFRGVAPLVALGCVLAAAVPAQAVQQRPGTTELVSVAIDGGPGNGRSEYAQVSRNGRFVVFESDASDLVEGDSNGSRDIFVRDLLSGTTERMNLRSDGTEAGFSTAGSISDDGRYVVFNTPWQLLPEDTDLRTDVYRRDRLTGELVLVTVADGGAQLAEGATVQETRPAISGDGRRVVFRSGEANVVPGVQPPALAGTNRTGAHIYLRDLETERTVLVSASSDGTPGTHSSQTPTISADGSTVAFETQSPLIPDNGDSTDIDVYVKNVDTGAVRQAAVSDAGNQTNYDSWRPVLSRDGSFVAFDSIATNLTPRDQGGITPDVYMRDLEKLRVERVNMTAAGQWGFGSAYRASLSDDGRFVSYHSNGQHTPDTQGETSPTNVFVLDRETGAVEFVSATYDGRVGNTTSQLSTISGDGSVVTWESRSSLLETPQANGETQVYARYRGNAIGVFGPLGVDVAGGLATISGTARVAGQRLTKVTDELGDVRAAAQERDVLGDLSGAEVSVRFEEADQLMIRVLASPLAVFSGIPGAPGAVYGAAFEVDGVPFEIRAGGGELIRENEFQLWRCEIACIYQEVIRGSYANAGSEYRMTFPFTSVGAAEGSRITKLRAFASLGTIAAHEPMDTVSLPDVTVPVRQVFVGVGERESAVDLGSDGSFSGDVDLAGLKPGIHEAFARVCSGDVCRRTASEIEIARAGTELELALRRVGGNVQIAAVLTEAGGTPLAGQTVVFSVAGKVLGTAVTDSNGRAVKVVKRSLVRDGDEVLATFERTDAHEGSKATAVYRDAKPPKPPKLPTDEDDDD